MRIVGPNGFKAAAFIHDKKVISATKNIGWCSGWPVDRFTRFVEQRGWQIIRDDDGEGAGERPVRATFRGACWQDRFAGSTSR
jgi:hypothetical protein